jgi:hypothetical protein
MTHLQDNSVLGMKVPAKPAIPYEDVHNYNHQAQGDAGNCVD